MTRFLAILTVLLTVIFAAGLEGREAGGCPVSILEHAAHDGHSHGPVASTHQAAGTDHAAVPGLCKSGCGTITLLAPAMLVLPVPHKEPVPPIAVIRAARSGSPSPDERPPKPLI